MMNERIKSLLVECGAELVKGTHNGRTGTAVYLPVGQMFDFEKFAELIVRECCLALWTEECHTSDIAFDEVKRNATRIKEHFGIDPREITEEMLTRSIKWMEQQLANQKQRGVEL
jgi:hypothetical protein